MSPTEHQADLRRELEERIEQLERADDAAFGGFGGYDWLVLVLSCIVAPILLAVAFR
ncbi:MAG: hypothetical protein GTN86_02230 [Xanthomonadales bacterium]|nr:hypothetical protein [Xanthomonadales bacterium]NIN58831.1 hypothetical protein [Xanthomonadales bacterium]NIN74099.1 hypothetical protein [Xanthomonadales bacterium]NIO14632.1 hypothetical protein [Xanthomonadales bacterium]NIP11224.1 hypothetical protein [Xanthomonadales bacterium]